MTVQKAKSFTDTICEMRVEGLEDFDPYYESTIRTLISSRQKDRPNLPLNKYPNREYSANKMEVPYSEDSKLKKLVLRVKRIK